MFENFDFDNFFAWLTEWVNKIVDMVEHVGEWYNKTFPKNDETIAPAGE